MVTLTVSSKRDLAVTSHQQLNAQHVLEQADLTGDCPGGDVQFVCDSDARASPDCFEGAHGG